jgi:hypothetical protein
LMGTNLLKLDLSLIMTVSNYQKLNIINT